MKVTLTTAMALNLMAEAGCDNFTYEAMEAIIEYYDETGYEIEFNPVEIDCEWLEFGRNCEFTFDDLFNDYSDLVDDEDEVNIDTIIEALSERTYVVALEGDNVLVQNF